MCFETSSTKIKNDMEFYSRAEFKIPLEYEPFYHKSGFTNPNLQIIKMDEPTNIYPASWGLVPDWGMDDIPAFRKKYNTLNTKSENLFKGISKGSAYDKRCLIIADGFFEPHKVKNSSIPYYCHIPTKEYDDGRDMFCFAGIYSEIDKTANAFTCSILTMDANDFFAEIHNVKKRMPLVLDDGLHKEWLNDSLKEKNVVELMKHGFTSKKFDAYPVSRNLYKRGVDTNNAEILKPIEKGTLF